MGRAVDRIADVVTTASRCSASMCLTKSGIFIENSVLMKMAGTTSLTLETWMVSSHHANWRVSSSSWCKDTRNATTSNMTLSSVQHFRVCFRGLREICTEHHWDMWRRNSRHERGLDTLSQAHTVRWGVSRCHVVRSFSSDKEKGQTNYKLTLALESVRHTPTSGNTKTRGLHLTLWCGMQISAWFSFRQVRQSCDDRLDVFASWTGECYNRFYRQRQKTW